MPDSIGNSLNDAQSIIIGTTAKRFSDSVEFGDQDYFRFTLASASSFSLVLSGLSANADVELLDSLGNAITRNTVLLRSTNEGSVPDTINTFLDPGTYYIRVFPGPASDPNNAIGTTPSTNYTLDVSADNGIRNDIAWRNYGAAGYTSLWRMDGTNFQDFVATTPVADPNWVLSGAADFNGDGISDLLWRYYGSGDGSGVNAIWLMDANGSVGSAFYINPVPDLNWQIRGVGNFDNGVGGPDIFWQNVATGAISTWFLDDTFNVTSLGVLPSFPTGTQGLATTGDFNGDGNTDLVYRLASGYNEIYFSAGGFNFSDPVTLTPDLNLAKQIQGAGDFNGDGFDDILWRDFATGNNEVWLMEGASVTSVVPILGVSDPNWRAITPYKRIEPLVLSDLAGDSLQDPLSIGPLNGNGVYRDAIQGTDTQDYYRFTLGSRTRLDLSLNGFGTNALQGNLDVQILSSVGAVVAQGTTSGNSPESLTNLNLNPGTYFIRVFAGGVGEASQYDLNLTVNNLPILASSGPLTVNEGASQTLSSTALLVTDENDPPEKLIYSLITPPSLANGSLLSNGQALIANSTFTQADVNSGKIVYQQNGSELPLDTFVFSVVDGRGGIIPNTTFTVNVTPVNDPPQLRSLNPVTVSEGALVTLSNTNLLLTDVEQGPSQLIYTLSSLPTAGTLSLLSGTLVGPLTLGSTFTQADLNSNRIGLRHNGSETTTDSFTFVATDGAGGFLNPQTQTLAINILPVNDPPVLVTNVALTVSQAGPGFITSALLRATDAEWATPAQQDQIRYTVTNLPTSGTLFFNGVAQSSNFTFSQADLNTGSALSYAQGGNPSNSDRFTFRISDGIATIPTTGDYSYDIFIQRVTSPPVLATPNPQITLSEGTAALISTGTLQVTDADSAPFLITYTLGSTPTSGSVVRSGITLTTGQTFTQQDIDSSRIQYQHNGNEQPAADAFTFTFKDETGAGPTGAQTFSISIISVNDPPTLLTPNSQTTVTEGFSTDLTSALLNATDPDNLASGITYTIANDPTNGTILRSGTKVTSFTQADVNGGQIKYLQNGSESTADSFSFSIADANGASGGNGTVNINVIPFNDAPGIAAITPLTLAEGSATVIDAGALTITDVDGPGPITYTVGTLPINGILKRGNVTLSTGGTFTQADIDGSQLTYVHSGSETTSDRFTFTASDGATTGAGAPGLVPLTTFTIAVTPVNDDPGISLNTGITLSEGGLSVLSGNILRATDPDNLTSQLTYDIQSGPTNGTLLSAGVAVQFFTQAQLNGNIISYRHNGSETTLDEFTFQVNDGSGGSSPVQTFSIGVTPVNDSPTLLANLGIGVDEAGTVTITDSQLLATDPDGPSDTVIFTLGALPTRGSVLRNGVTLSTGQTFTQADVTGGLLSYIDNGNDPVANDRFTFTGSDGSTGLIPLRTFSLTINPINDAPIITAPTTVSAVEDTTFTFGGASTLSVADVDGGPTYNVQLSTSAGGTINLASTTGLTGLSGNNSSAVSFSSSLGNLNNAIRTLRYRGTQDFNGPEELVISVDDGNGGNATRTVSLNVTAVNDGPTLTASTATLALLEDQNPAPTFNFTVDDIDIGTSPMSVVLRATNGGITVSDTGTLSFDPAGANGSSVVIFTGLLTDVQTALSSVQYQSNPNYFGSDRIVVSVNDQGATGAPGATPSTVSRTINVTVTSVNDAPTFTVTGNSVINVNEDSPTQVVPFASAISTGAPNETQGLSFSIAPNSAADAALLPNLFTATPTINPTSGNLTFTPKANANGTVTLQAFLVDNGGTANGGQNTSVPFTFVLEVNQVNDAPGFTRATVPSVTEDAGPITINNWATNISVGPSTAAANESTQSPTFIFDTSNPSLFAPGGGPQVVNLAGNTAALTYTAAPDANGIATVTVRLQDDGGTANGGQDTSAPQTFTINVLSKNDAPTFNQLQTSVDVLEDDPQQTVQIADSIVVGPFNELTQTATFSISSNSNPNLFLATGGGIAPTINPQGFLNFKTAANANGSAVIVARLIDNGGTANGGTNQSAPFTFTINAAAVNDAPSFTKGADITVAEDAPAQSIANWARSITPGPNESTQTVAFGVDTDNPSLFAVLPTIDPTGRLTYTPAANAYGTAIVTVSLVDNGGTQFGGVDTSPIQTFKITVTPVNDAPTLTLPSGQITQEDQPIDFSGALGIQFTDIDAGNTPVQVQLTVRNGSILLPSTTGLTVTNGANGGSTVTFTGTLADLTAAFASVVYTPKQYYNGTDGLTVVVNDLGAFGSGGAKLATGTVPITVTSVNNAPQLLTLGQLTVGEGGSSTIGKTLLTTTDVDNTAAQVVYTLISAPATGSLRLQTTTIALNGTFTQADINNGRLNYIQNGSESTTDNFVFRVSDGQIPLPDTTFDINIIPVDDPPGLSLNLGATVSEGNVVTIDNTLLQYTDNDNASTELLYTLTSIPSGGFLRLGGSDLTVGSTFTQDQVDTGLLTYEQNGSESTSDSFNFNLGDRTTTLQGVFNISVTPVNDPPRFISQGALTVSEGASAPVAVSILNTTDPDTPTNQLIYTVTGGPGFGTLLRNNTTTILVGQTFTQAEINSGAISYRNNGSEVSSDAFFFTVTDGTNSDSGILNINVLPVNDPPTIVRSTGITLSAATPTTKVLNNSQLYSTDVDNPNATDIRYVINTLPNPAIGQLLLGGAPMTVGQFFTQDDINKGKVSYKYLGNGTIDGFQYTVQDSGGASGGSRLFQVQFT